MVPRIYCYVGRSRGFGFVTFESANAAKDVLAEQEHIIDGRKVCLCERGREKEHACVLKYIVV